MLAGAQSKAKQKIETDSPTFAQLGAYPRKAKSRKWKAERPKRQPPIILAAIHTIIIHQLHYKASSSRPERSGAPACFGQGEI
ncbi:hypothetical protein DBR40_26030 [Pedobacter sp. KBW01]|nr:hypothetical protein DBR40_26030 [Pedobacter sp. KBW01]